MKDMAYTARGVNVVTSVYRETGNYCGSIWTTSNR